MASLWLEHKGTADPVRRRLCGAPPRDRWSRGAGARLDGGADEGGVLRLPRVELVRLGIVPRPARRRRSLRRPHQLLQLGLREISEPPPPQYAAASSRRIRARRRQPEPPPQQGCDTASMRAGAAHSQRHPPQRGAPAGVETRGDHAVRLAHWASSVAAASERCTTSRSASSCRRCPKCGHRCPWCQQCITGGWAKDGLRCCMNDALSDCRLAPEGGVGHAADKGAHVGRYAQALHLRCRRHALLAAACTTSRAPGIRLSSPRSSSGRVARAQAGRAAEVKGHRCFDK